MLAKLLAKTLFAHLYKPHSTQTFPKNIFLVNVVLRNTIYILNVLMRLMSICNDERYSLKENIMVLRGRQAFAIPVPKIYAPDLLCKAIKDSKKTEIPRFYLYYALHKRFKKLFSYCTTEVNIGITITAFNAERRNIKVSGGRCEQSIP